MAIFELNALRSYYFANPAEFIRTLGGDSSVSQLYRDLIGEVVRQLSSTFNSITSSTAVQMDLDGKVIFSNSDAKFAQTKEEIVGNGGSVEKVSPSEVLIASPSDHKAIILGLLYADMAQAGLLEFDSETITLEDEAFLNTIFSLDLKIGVSVPIWEYNSVNMVTAFHRCDEDEVIVKIRDDILSPTDVFIRQGKTIVWENNSASPIRVISGTTDYDIFQQDPDLALYGDVFTSPVLQPGERYSFKFVNVGEFNYFTYPDILTSSINVTRNRISSRDEFLILESDGLESPFSSRVIKVNSWGGIVWSFGNSYLVKPRDARPLTSGGVIIST